MEAARRIIVKWGMTIYLVIASANVLATFFQHQLLATICSFILIPSLMLFFYFRSLDTKDFTRWMVLFSLFLFWASEVAKVIVPEDKTDGLLYKVVPALVAYFCYIIVFLRLQYTPKKLQDFAFLVIRIIILIIIIIGLYAVIGPYLFEYKFLYSIYLIIISIMAVIAILRRNNCSAKSYSYIYGGVLFYIVSESIYAINFFSYYINSAVFWMLLTSILAHFSVVSGIIRHYDDESGDGTIIKEIHFK